jgi:translation elongation factor EF-1alpha
MKMDLLIGLVTHYYDKIGVAVVAVENQSLKIGDSIKFSGHDQEFTQQLTSMQSEHEQITEAKPGDIVGLKTDKSVKKDDKVYLMS